MSELDSLFICLDIYNFNKNKHLNCLTDRVSFYSILYLIKSKFRFETVIMKIVE